MPVDIAAVMTTRRGVLNAVIPLFLLWLITPTFAQSDKPVAVVATFSVLGDMVQSIGGEHIAITTLVGPDGDTHVYQPTPADARAVSEAKVLFVNGLEFEGWLERLIGASDFRGDRVVATEGIEPIPGEHAGHDDRDEHAGHDDRDEHAGRDDHDEHAGRDDHDEHAGRDDHDEHDEHDDHDEHAGHDDHDEHAGRDDHDDHDEHDEHDDHDEHAGHDDHDEHAGHHHHGAFDPHAWQSLHNAAVYIDNITAALAKAAPANASAFYQNREVYLAQVEALDAEIRDWIAPLSSTNRTVVTSHDAFQYFGRDYGLTFISPQGLSTESEVSAQDVAHLIEQIREQEIRAVFIENISDSRLLKLIADETGAVIGGTLYPGALSGPDGPASTYLELMRHNAMTLAKALAW